MLIEKYRRRFTDFDDKIISLHGRGISTREIQGHVRQLYGIEISPDLVSAVTDAVHDEIKAWQTRPLEPCHAIVFCDAVWPGECVTCGVAWWWSLPLWLAGIPQS
ncbi:MAG: transposase [Gammaproteobacteria bacterium]